MIEQLKILVESLGMAFFYGTRKQFNQRADDHATGPLVYHEGYVQSRRTWDAQGALVTTYPLVLWVYLPSELEESETERLPRFNTLSDKANELASALKTLGKFTAYQVTEGLNDTNRNLDGLRMTGDLVVTSTTRC